MAGPGGAATGPAERLRLIGLLRSLSPAADRPGPGHAGPPPGGESLDAARAVFRNQLDRLAARHVPAEGHLLLHAADHGAAGRMVAEYANTAGASTIVVGAPTHGGLPALMDDSATRGLSRLARSNVLVVNPDAPAGVPAEDLRGELARD